MIKIEIEVEKSDLQKLEKDLNLLPTKLGEAVAEFSSDVIVAWKQSIVDNRAVDTGMMVKAVDFHGGFQSDSAKVVFDIDTRRDSHGESLYLEEGTKRIKPKKIVAKALQNLEQRRALETRIDRKVNEALRGNKK